MRAPLVRTRYNAIGRQRQVHGRPSCVSAIPNLTDLRPAPADILGDVLAGLAQRTRRLHSKYFYEIGRASCGERVCQYVSISVVADSLNKKTHKTVNNTH